MTHLSRTKSDQIENIVNYKWLLLKMPTGITFGPGDKYILQPTDIEEPETELKISSITHSVPGLLKNWVIISFE